METAQCAFFLIRKEKHTRAHWDDKEKQTKDIFKDSGEEVSLQSSQKA